MLHFKYINNSINIVGQYGLSPLEGVISVNTATAIYGNAYPKKILLPGIGYYQERVDLMYAVDSVFLQGLQGIISKEHQIPYAAIFLGHGHRLQEEMNAQLNTLPDNIHTRKLKGFLAINQYIEESYFPTLKTKGKTLESHLEIEDFYNKFSEAKKAALNGQFYASEINYPTDPEKSYLRSPFKYNSLISAIEKRREIPFLNKEEKSDAQVEIKYLVRQVSTSWLSAPLDKLTLAQNPKYKENYSKENIENIERPVKFTSQIQKLMGVVADTPTRAASIYSEIILKSKVNPLKIAFRTHECAEANTAKSCFKSPDYFQSGPFTQFTSRLLDKPEIEIAQGLQKTMPSLTRDEPFDLSLSLLDVKKIRAEKTGTQIFDDSIVLFDNSYGMYFHKEADYTTHETDPFTRIISTIGVELPTIQKVENPGSLSQNKPVEKKTNKSGEEEVQRNRSQKYLALDGNGQPFVRLPGTVNITVPNTNSEQEDILPNLIVTLPANKINFNDGIKIDPDFTLPVWIHDAFIGEPQVSGNQKKSTFLMEREHQYGLIAAELELKNRGIILRQPDFAGFDSSQETNIRFDIQNHQFKLFKDDNVKDLNNSQAERRISFENLGLNINFNLDNINKCQNPLIPQQGLINLIEGLSLLNSAVKLMPEVKSKKAFIYLINSLKAPLIYQTKRYTVDKTNNDFAFKQENFEPIITTKERTNQEFFKQLAQFKENSYKTNRAILSMLNAIESNLTPAEYLFNSTEGITNAELWLLGGYEVIDNNKEVYSFEFYDYVKALTNIPKDKFIESTFKFQKEFKTVDHLFISVEQVKRLALAESYLHAQTIKANSQREHRGENQDGGNKPIENSIRVNRQLNIGAEELAGKIIVASQNVSISKDTKAKINKKTKKQGENIFDWNIPTTYTTNFINTDKFNYLLENTYKLSKEEQLEQLKELSKIHSTAVLRAQVHPDRQARGAGILNLFSKEHNYFRVPDGWSPLPSPYNTHEVNFTSFSPIQSYYVPLLLIKESSSGNEFAVSNEELKSVIKHISTQMKGIGKDLDNFTLNISPELRNNLIGLNISLELIKDKPKINQYKEQPLKESFIVIANKEHNEFNKSKSSVEIPNVRMRTSENISTIKLSGDIHHRHLGPSYSMVRFVPEFNFQPTSVENPVDGKGLAEIKRASGLIELETDEHGNVLETRELFSASNQKHIKTVKRIPSLLQISERYKEEQKANQSSVIQTFQNPIISTPFIHKKTDETLLTDLPTSSKTIKQILEDTIIVSSADIDKNKIRDVPFSITFSGICFPRSDTFIGTTALYGNNLKEDEYDQNIQAEFSKLSKTLEQHFNPIKENLKKLYNGKRILGEKLDSKEFFKEEESTDSSSSSSDLNIFEDIFEDCEEYIASDTHILSLESRFSNALDSISETDIVVLAEKHHAYLNTNKSSITHAHLKTLPFIFLFESQTHKHQALAHKIRSNVDVDNRFRDLYYGVDFYSRGVGNSDWKALKEELNSSDKDVIGKKFLLRNSPSLDSLGSSILKANKKEKKGNESFYDINSPIINASKCNIQQLSNDMGSYNRAKIISMDSNETIVSLIQSNFSNQPLKFYPTAVYKLMLNIPHLIVRAATNNYEFYYVDRPNYAQGTIPLRSRIPFYTQFSRLIERITHKYMYVERSREHSKLSKHQFEELLKKRPKGSTLSHDEKQIMFNEAYTHGLMSFFTRYNTEKEQSYVNMTRLRTTPHHYALKRAAAREPQKGDTTGKRNLYTQTKHIQQELRDLGNLLFDLQEGCFSKLKNRSKGVSLANKKTIIKAIEYINKYRTARLLEEKQSGIIKGLKSIKENLMPSHNDYVSVYQNSEKGLQPGISLNENEISNNLLARKSFEMGTSLRDNSNTSHLEEEIRHSITVPRGKHFQPTEDIKLFENQIMRDERYVNDSYGNLETIAFAQDINPYYLGIFSTFSTNKFSITVSVTDNGSVDPVVTNSLNETYTYGSTIHNNIVIPQLARELTRDSITLFNYLISRGPIFSLITNTLFGGINIGVGSIFGSFSYITSFVEDYVDLSSLTSKENILDHFYGFNFDSNEVFKLLNYVSGTSSSENTKLFSINIRAGGVGPYYIYDDKTGSATLVQSDFTQSETILESIMNSVGYEQDGFSFGIYLPYNGRNTIWGDDSLLDLDREIDFSSLTSVINSVCGSEIKIKSQRPLSSHFAGLTIKSEYNIDNKVEDLDLYNPVSNYFEYMLPNPIELKSIKIGIGANIGVNFFTAPTSSDKFGKVQALVPTHPSWCLEGAIYVQHLASFLVFDFTTQAAITFRTLTNKDITLYSETEECNALVTKEGLVEDLIKIINPINKGVQKLSGVINKDNIKERLLALQAMRNVLGKHGNAYKALRSFDQTDFENSNTRKLDSRSLGDKEHKTDRLVNVFGSEDQEYIMKDTLVSSYLRSFDYNTVNTDPQFIAENDKPIMNAAAAIVSIVETDWMHQDNKYGAGDKINSDLDSFVTSDGKYVLTTATECDYATALINMVQSAQMAHEYLLENKTLNDKYNRTTDIDFINTNYNIIPQEHLVEAIRINDSALAAAILHLDRCYSITRAPKTLEILNKLPIQIPTAIVFDGLVNFTINYTLRLDKLVGFIYNVF